MNASSLCCVVHALAAMSIQRLQSRSRRSIDRLLSPRRLLATIGAMLFLLLYVVNGVFVILTRKPVATDTLSAWLGGAMAIYAIFHFVRAAWQEPDARLGLTPAESLWLGRAPVQNHVLVLYRLATIVPSTLIKTLLLATVLLCDISSPLRLVFGLSVAMLMLEAIRMIADRIAASLSPTGRAALRTAMTSVAVSIVAQQLALTVVATAGSSHPLALLNAFTRASGETANSYVIQWLAIPWTPTIHFAVANTLNANSLLYGIASIGIASLAVVAVIAVDRWATWHQNWVEGALKLDRHPACQFINDSLEVYPTLSLISLPRFQGIGPLMARQWVGIWRYRGTILVSLAVPAALSLSPLLTSGDAGLLHVAAWLSVSTLLLAPPALRVDFRRDIDRIWLLKSLPVTPLIMTIGQIALPSLITIVFQLVVITIACLIAPAALTTVVLVAGGLSGLAVISFAIENSLFLTFPHRVKQEGLAMMVRAKLVFLGKGLLLAILAAAFVFAVTLTATTRASIGLLVIGCITTSWTFAAVAVALTARCWQRFDLRLDF